MNYEKWTKSEFMMLFLTTLLTGAMCFVYGIMLQDGWGIITGGVQAVLSLYALVSTGRET